MSERDHSQGPANAPVTLVEYGEAEVVAGAHAGRVREDFLSGVHSGVNGTPTFFINGRRHDDSYDLETLLAAVERAERTAHAGRA